MPTLTVFTPTFNRGYILSRCYESLKRQTNKDFVWLIVDDGSSDHTRDMVEGWAEEGIVPIRYHWQENQGMHGAHNAAYELIETELNVCIDSDDYMPDDAVENIVSFWRKHGSDRVSGIVGLDSDIQGRIIGSKLPDHIPTSTLFDLYHKHGVTGDKKVVYRSELTKRYPYPLFTGEKLVALSYKYYMLDRDYEMLTMNQVICCVEYLPDGSTRNILSQYTKNPRGFSFYRKELMKLPFGSKPFKFKQAVHYVSSSLLSANNKFLRESPDPKLTLTAIPLGIALYFYLLWKKKAA
ncbi:glycosyltransferase family 2 protein [Paenibacillus sp.]|uniref:glycosyltransferase family 2 protein n=1 Tax=Paenibacillus sp. TaxID=58172 RepID=UPI002811CC0D|nr:glycosyltransferase family 2 protein [Paenibacillus sp.]